MFLDDLIFGGRRQMTARSPTSWPSPATGVPGLGHQGAGALVARRRRHHPVSRRTRCRCCPTPSWPPLPGDSPPVDAASGDRHHRRAPTPCGTSNCRPSSFRELSPTATARPDHRHHRRLYRGAADGLGLVLLLTITAAGAQVIRCRAANATGPQPYRFTDDDQAVAGGGQRCHRPQFDDGDAIPDNTSNSTATRQGSEGTAAGSARPSRTDHLPAVNFQCGECRRHHAAASACATTTTGMTACVPGSAPDRHRDRSDATEHRHHLQARPRR